MSEIDVEQVEPARLFDLRRRVLRGNDPTRPVSEKVDNDPTTRHFAGILDGRLVASASFYLASAPRRPELVSYQLRFMAVDFDVQGRGYGAVVLSAAEEELRRMGAGQIWANARDSALGFYVATGWSVIEGSENISPLSDLPHTEIIKLLVQETV